MTPEDQRIAIAEWMGWKQSRHEFRVATVTGWISPLGEWEISTPDYLNDLNAMHEAREKLDEKQRFRFIEVLEQIQKPLNAAPWHWTWNLAHASAAQHAEALLKTIGKWKE